MDFFTKADPKSFQSKDEHLVKSLGTRDFLALGVGTIISTSIFTLPGQVAAEFAGPAVVISYLLASVVAGLVAFAYAEMATVMPFAGSAYSWISVLFGEGFGWIAGWALLAEYFVAVAFVASGFSGTFRAFLATFNLSLPYELRTPLITYAGKHLIRGGAIDIVSLLVILLSAFIVWRGASDAGKVSQVLIVLKIAAILVFVFVGISVIKPHNYVPFVPQHSSTTVGGVSGIWAGVSTIFLAYIGFDSIAANSAEAKDPRHTMPRGILGSLLIAVALFTAVTLVLVGMHPYYEYAGNSAPVSWALSQSGFTTVSRIVSIIADAGMFVALLGMSLAGSRLLYSFGRDGKLPSFLGKLNKHGLPSNGIITLTVITALIGAVLPFQFLVQLISAGTLIAFMLVSLGMFSLRHREGKDLPMPSYKMPLYPVLPVLGFIASAFVFYGLQDDAKIYAALWFLLGLVIYFARSIYEKHAIHAKTSLAKTVGTKA